MFVKTWVAIESRLILLEVTALIFEEGSHSSITSASIKFGVGLFNVSFGL